MSIEIKPCPECGGVASTGSGNLLGIPGWTTDCNHCMKAPRVTRFTRDESIKAWNHLVSSALAAKKG